MPKFPPRIRPDATQILTRTLADRILLLDGAMGTAIQRDRPDESGYRGTRFKNWPTDVIGNNELLNLTQPDLITGIHQEYLQAGADIIETNTFNANAVSLADYGMEELDYELNYTGASLARDIADQYSTSTRPRYVAGAIGPTTRTASISPDVDDPGARNVTFDQLVAAYLVAGNALLDGGADLLLVETIFDTLNAKAAIFAVESVYEARGRRWPLILSGTVVDASGRNLSGQTTEAFWNSVRHAKPVAVGLNCGLSPQQMRPHLIELSRVAGTHVSAYFNAGLPNAFGEYDETPDQAARYADDITNAALTNIVGGCCGTTPEHIAAIAETIRGKAPRPVPTIRTATRLAGLEPLNVL